MDCFTHVHKREPGKHIRCWWELYISCIWICRLTEKVFRSVSKNEKVSTVPTLPDVQQFPTPGVPPSGYACSYRACTLLKSRASACSWWERSLSHTNPAVRLGPSSEQQTQTLFSKLTVAISDLPARQKRLPKTLCC